MSGASTALRDILLLALNVFNDVIILFFVVGNGVYTIFTLMSFAYVWIYQKRVGHATLREVKESPETALTESSVSPAC